MAGKEPTADRGGLPEDFRSEVRRVNDRRVGLFVVVVLLLHIPLLVIDVGRLMSGMLAEHLGYRYLFIFHLILFLGLLIVLILRLAEPPEEEDIGGDDYAPPPRTWWHRLRRHLFRPGRLSRSLTFPVALFVLAIATLISVTDQFIHGQITVYVMTSVAAAVVLYLTWPQAVFLYGAAHVLFIAGLGLAQDNLDILTGHYINGTIIVVLSVVITRTLYVQHRNTYRHQVVIEEQRRRLERMATEDSLTGLHNRRYIDERIEEELQWYDRRGRVFSVAVADIDHFKDVNDAFGHKAGDEVLRRLARILVPNVRAVDIVARYGGEEFVFLFPETTRPVAHEISEKLRGIVEEHDWGDIAGDLSLTMSFGVAESTEASDVHAIIDRADLRLYHAKRLGRNRVVSSRD